MNYERLEFLGDRVLGLVVADMLFQKFPGDNEGALARRHTALVRREALALVAHHIDLGSYLRLSRGEEDAGGRSNPSLLADCCEAVIGALYLDGGLEAAARFIHRRWQVLLSGEHAPPKDAKSALQEWVQGDVEVLDVRSDGIELWVNDDGLVVIIQRSRESDDPARH